MYTYININGNVPAIWTPPSFHRDPYYRVTQDALLESSQLHVQVGSENAQTQKKGTQEVGK